MCERQPCPELQPDKARWLVNFAAILHKVELWNSCMYCSHDFIKKLKKIPGNIGLPLRFSSYPLQIGDFRASFEIFVYITIIRR